MKIGIVISLTALLIILLLASPNGSFIHLAYASDTYSNDINFIEIWQYNGTDWVLRWNLTSNPEGETYRIHDNQPTNFTVSIKFNNTLASSVEEAISYTRVYMNITDIWDNAELNNTSCELIGDFYYLTKQGYWNQTGYPEAGVTYECSVLYQGYY